MAKISMDAFRRSTRTNSDTLKLLQYHSLFIELVKELRSTFEVPTDGFKEGKECSEWYDRVLLVGSDEYMDSASFKAELREIHTLWTEQKIAYKERERRYAETNAKVPINAWNGALKNLTLRFGLAENFKDIIQSFVLYNKMSGVPTNYSIQTNPDDRHAVSIKIYGPIRDEDRKTIMQEAEKLAKLRNPRAWKKYKPLGNIDRDLNILQLSGSKNKSHQDSPIGSDEDIAANIFQDEETPFAEMRSRDRKNALLVAKARGRIRKILRDRFPDDTFTS